MKNENYDIIMSCEKNNWWYKAKRDLVELLIKNCDKTFESSLDIGCGVGSNSEVLNKFSKRVTGIDYSKKAIEYCKEKNYDELKKMDATNLKFKDNSFDLILCSDVLEHIDDEKAINEIKRILKPGGIFVFTVPAHMHLWGPTDYIAKHLRRYDKKRLKKLMSQDFTMLKYSYWNLVSYFPDLVFIKLAGLLNKREEEKNALQLIPKSVNELLYRLLLIENRFFLKMNLMQGRI